MATLSEKQAELALAKAALRAAEVAVQYSQGDRTLTRARLGELEARVARLARDVAEMEARAISGKTSAFVVARWD